MFGLNRISQGTFLGTFLDVRFWGFRRQNSEAPAPNPKPSGQGEGFLGLGFRVRGLEFWAEALGSGVQGLGFSRANDALISPYNNECLIRP